MQALEQYNFKKAKGDSREIFLSFSLEKVFIFCH